MRSSTPITMKVRSFEPPLRFMVSSEHDDETEYLVDLGEGEGICSCWRSYNFRERCKHLQLVRDQFCDEMISRVRKLDLNEKTFPSVQQVGTSTVPEQGDRFSLSQDETLPKKDPYQGVSKGGRSLKSIIEELTLIYKTVDVEAEIDRMKAWLAIPANKRRKLTYRFIVNWLNHTDSPIEIRTDVSAEDRTILSMDPLTMTEEQKHRWTMLDYTRKRA